MQIVPESLPEMSDVELLEHYRGEIRRGDAKCMEGWQIIGRALSSINEGCLYKIEGYKSFRQFCLDEFEIGKSHAYRFINAFKLYDKLKASPHGDTLPINEGQIRPLTSLPEEDAAQVWEECIEQAPKDESGKPIVERITNSDVQEKVDLWKADDEPYIERQEIELLEDVVSDLAELNGNKFGTIYADPPWSYGNQATRAATDNHYRTLTVEQICAEPVAQIAEENAHLHLWTTNGFLREAFQVIEAWGFAYKSCFVWVKPQMGIGNYWRVSHEFLLLGVRGSKPFDDKSLKSWLELPRTKHSRKPREVREAIMKASSGPYLEMYGRERMEDWTIYGNQIERTIFDGDEHRV